jgi:hypothetical protein
MKPSSGAWLWLNPAPNMPPFLSSNGLVVDRAFVTADERAGLLAYLRKL